MYFWWPLFATDGLSSAVFAAGIGEGAQDRRAAGPEDAAAAGERVRFFLSPRVLVLCFFVFGGVESLKYFWMLQVLFCFDHTVVALEHFFVTFGLCSVAGIVAR